MKRSYRILLSVLSGILLSLPWLGFPGWILFFAFLPLLYLDHFFVKNRGQFRGVSFWGHTWLAFFIWNILTTWWIMHATKLGAALAIIANSFIMSLIWWLAHTARRNLRSNLGYIALAVFWISFEYFHYHWDVEWPWLTLGNGFANQVKMIQWYEFTGTLGGSLWVLILNIILFQTLSELLLNKSPVKSEIVNLISIFLLLIVPVIISRTMYSNYKEEQNPKDIVIVQPNIDPYSEKFDLAAENKKMETLLKLASEKTTDATDFIIGPETVFENPTYWNEDEFDGNRFIIQLESFIHRYSKAEMILGVSSYKKYPDKEHATITARNRNGMIYDMFNTAIIFRAYRGAAGISQIKTCGWCRKNAVYKVSGILR